MKIKHRAGSKHGNPDALSRFETRSCPRQDCPDPGHKVPKRKLSKHKDQEILNPLLICRQTSANKDFDINCAVVQLFKEEEIKDAQYRDPDLSQFMNLFI